MWICVYDPADAPKVGAAFGDWPRSHWEYDLLRHGTPFMEEDRAVVFVTAGRDEASRLPMLAGLESADLVMFHCNVVAEAGVRHIPPEGMPAWYRALTPADAVLALELTTQNPGNSNGVQRMGRVEDHTALGIPFLYIAPQDGMRRATEGGIAGNHGDERLRAAQRRAVRDNTPVTPETVGGQGLGGCPFDEAHHPDPQASAGWTEQCLLVHGDSNRVPVAHLSLPTSWAVLDDRYRYAGCQLEVVFSFLRDVMRATERDGIQAGRNHPRWEASRASLMDRDDEQGYANDALVEYGMAHGFSAGAIQSQAGALNRRNVDHHFLSRAQARTLSFRPLSGGLLDATATIEAWCRPYAIDPEMIDRLRPHLDDRYFLLTRRIPQAEHLSKDTYTGGMHVTDWLLTRRDAEHWDAVRYPRAVSTDPRHRLHLYTVTGPWTSVSARRHTRSTHIYGGRTLRRVDLFKCEDGVFFGGPLAELCGVEPWTPLAR